MTNTIKIACVGDSITKGAACYDYPARLSDVLGDGYLVKNFGVSGRTLLKCGLELDGELSSYWDTDAYIESKDFNPDIVIIMLGTNDSKPINRQFISQYCSDYMELVKSYRDCESKPTVYIATSPFAQSEGFGITNEVVSGEIVPLQLQIAKELNCPVIDINAATKGMSGYFPDGVHPNDDGYAVIAVEMASKIMKVKQGVNQ